MYIPNVFAPEIGSGEGAVFLPKTKNLVEYRLQIFENGKVWDGMVDPKTGKKSVMGAVLLLR
jgi:hypothetical protein